MLLTAFLPWFLEWCLEVHGFVRAFPRRLTAVWLVLGFCSLADPAAFIIQHFYGWNIYIWAYWIQKGGKYLLLCALAAYIAGKLLNAHLRLVYGLAAALALAAGTIWIMFACSGEGIADKLLDGGTAAVAVLTAGMVLAWLEPKKTLPRPWNLIAAGLVILLLGDAVILTAVRFWWPLHHLKWLPEFAQLGLWNYAFRGKLVEARIPLQARGERLMVLRKLWYGKEIRLPHSVRVEGAAQAKEAE